MYHIESNKIKSITYPTCVWRPKMFGVRKLESLGYHLALYVNIMFSRFSRPITPICDRRMDGHTDRRTHDDSVYRASIASRGNNQLRIIGRRWTVLSV